MKTTRRMRLTAFLCAATFCTGCQTGPVSNDLKKPEIFDPVVEVTKYRINKSADQPNQHTPLHVDKHASEFAKLRQALRNAEHDRTLAIEALAEAKRKLGDIPEDDSETRKAAENTVAALQRQADLAELKRAEWELRLREFEFEDATAKLHRAEQDIASAPDDQAKQTLRDQALKEAIHAVTKQTDAAMSLSVAQAKVQETEDDSQPPGESEFVETTLEVWTAEHTASEFGRYFASVFYACDVQFTNKTAEDLLIYGSSLKNLVHYRMTKRDVAKYFGYNEGEHDPMDLVRTLDKTGRDLTSVSSENYDGWTNYLSWNEYRRPMSFSDVLAIFERDRQGNAKQRAIAYLQAIGELATGASVFVNHRDYTKGVALFTGIFTPELEKLLLWDILLHLQNLQTRTLKEIEEVSAYGQIHRVVFFPRGAIHGLVRGVPVHIAEIEKGQARADAVAVAKLGKDAEDRQKNVTNMIATEVATSLLTGGDTERAKAAVTFLEELMKKTQEEN